MSANFPRVIFGEKTDLCVQATERDGTAFTISAATVTIKNTSTGTATRTAVSCTLDNTNLRASYLETFSAANGYAEDTTYTVTFKLTMSTAHIEKYEGRVTVNAANDE